MSNPETATEASDYLGASLRDSSASHTLETLLAVAPKAPFHKIWQLLFQGKIGKLATHPVANFVLAKAIDKLDEPALFEGVFQELKEAQSVATMIGWSPLCFQCVYYIMIISRVQTTGERAL